VPQILLALGALCLLVAAITFLAVAWSWLGVSGRTLVLVGLTGTALALTRVFLQRSLRTASEALSVVTLGLVALDVVGARHAGWFGDLSDRSLVLLTGAVVAAAALGLVLLSRPRPLVAPAVIAPVATLVAGFATDTDREPTYLLALDLVVLLLLGRLGALIRTRTLHVTAVACAAPAWLFVVGRSIDLARTDGAFTAARLWGEGAVVMLAVAVVLVAAAAPVLGLGRPVRLAGYGVAGLLAGYVAVLPTLDNGLTPATAALLVVAGACAAFTALAPRAWRPMGALPLVGSSAVPAYTAFSLLGSAIAAVLEVGDAFTQPIDVPVVPQPLQAARWLLLPCVVVLAGAACALVQCRQPLRRTSWLVAAAAAFTLGLVASLPLYDVPLAVVVGALLVLGVAVLVAAAWLSGRAAEAVRGVALLLLLAATLSALPNAVMTVVALAVVTTAAGWLTQRTDLTGDVAATVLPIALAGLVWSAAEVAGVPEVDRAVPILLLLGGLAIWRPQLEIESGAALAGTVAATASVLAADDVQLALAVHLTVAGALVTTTAIVHPTRRLLAWPGGLLLAAATWVRLAQLGVHTPEAYTLPAAIVLTTVGVWRLLHDEHATSLAVLSPGLTLATVPSLLVALEAPASLRALLLGVACLALVLTGVGLRCSAPLVVGSLVGTALVLRELAPYAAVVPTWVVIGVSGVLLTVVGVTWESRLRDVRTASRYVAGLR
jgi:hypothetical protein